MTTAFLCDGARVLLEKQGSATSAAYSYGNALTRKDREFPLFDGHGSERTVTNSSQSVTGTLNLLSGRVYRHPMKNRLIPIGAAIVLVGGVATTALCLESRHSIEEKRRSTVFSSIAWAGYDSICLSRKGGRIVERFPLRTRTGTTIVRPCFAFRGRSIVYWSPQDESLCVLSGTDPPRWIGLADQVLSDQRVVGISPTPVGVLLNLIKYNGGQSAGVLSVSLPAGRVVSVPDALQAKASEASDALAVLTASGSLEIRSGTSKVVVMEKAPASVITECMGWQFEPIESLVCYMDDGRIRVIGPHVNSNWNMVPAIGRRQFPFSLSIQGAPRQIWIYVARPFSQGFYLAAYTFEGKPLGTILSTPLPADAIYAPMKAADPDTVSMLERLGK